MQERNGPDTDLSDEERVRAMVREMWATPEGREVLEWLIDLPADKLTHVYQRLNRDINPPERQMTDEEVEAIVEAHIRSRFPNAPKDVADWDTTPLRPAGDQ